MDDYFKYTRKKLLKLQWKKCAERCHRSGRETHSSDIDILKHTLGEAWVCIKRTEWETISFTKLTKNDLQEIIQVAKQVRNKEKAEKIAIDEICNALISKE